MKLFLSTISFAILFAKPLGVTSRLRGFNPDAADDSLSGSPGHFLSNTIVRATYPASVCPAE